MISRLLPALLDLSVATTSSPLKNAIGIGFRGRAPTVLALIGRSAAVLLNGRMSRLHVAVATRRISSRTAS
jgi:hypothetical protein